MMKVAIIGSGPAGLALSMLLSKHDFCDVHLFERGPKLGEKLRTTGGGRMNVTNKLFGTDQFFSHSPKLMGHFFKSEWIADRFDIFEELGMNYVYEGNRAILASGDADKEVERMVSVLSKASNVTIHTKHEVQELDDTDAGWLLEYKNLEDDSLAETAAFDAVVIASGAMNRFGALAGESSIYRIALKLGLSLTELAPLLSPMKFSGNPITAFPGVALKGVMKNMANKKEVGGDILITHVGASGPAVLDFSAFFDEGDEVQLRFFEDVSRNDFINCFNELRTSKESLAGFFASDFFAQKLPKRILAWQLEMADLKPEMNIADVSKVKLQKLCDGLFAYSLGKPGKFPYQACWTTRGGIDLKDISMATLEVKKKEGVYLAGEILDIDGLCGGYNISFAIICAKIIEQALLKKSATF